MNRRFATFAVWFLSAGPLAAQVLLADVNQTGPRIGSSPGNFGDVGPTTLFGADDGLAGRELFATRGTAATTGRLLDLFPGPAGSDPSTPVLIGDRAVFLATVNNLVYCYRSDGSAAGTQIVPTGLDHRGMPPPLALDAHTAVVFGTFFDTFYQVRTNVIVRVTATGFTAEPWSYGTMLPPAAPFRTSHGVMFSSGTGATGRELWSEAGWMLDLDPGPDGSDPGASLHLELAGLTLFSANGGPGTGVELYRTDGTAAGTSLLADLAPGPASSGPRNGVVAGNVAFFVATHPALGAELWRSDGTAAGTWVIDVRPGAAGSEPDHLVAQHGGVYFAATDAAGDRELWFSDGSPIGTRRVADLAASASSSPLVLAAVGTRRVFFTADDGVHGRELFESDGTQAGTRMLAEIAPGNVDPGVTALHLRRDGLLLFAADDGVHGSELFVHDPGAVAIPAGGGCGATLAPRVAVTDPVLGSTALLRWSSTAAAAFGAIAIGFPGYAILPGGCEVQLDLAAPLAVLPIALSGGAGNGSLSVPGTPALAGLVLALQVFGGPTPTPLGFDVGNAIRLRLGR